MIEKNQQSASQHQRWEYEEIDTAAAHARGRDYKTQLAKLGDDGWEAYSVVAFEGGGMRFFLKRPVTIDPPPDGGRLVGRLPAPIDPPPDGG